MGVTLSGEKIECRLNGGLHLELRDDRIVVWREGEMSKALDLPLKEAARLLEQLADLLDYAGEPYEK